MRALNVGDVFRFARLINRPKLKEPLTAALKAGTGTSEADAAELGINIAWALVGAAAEDAGIERALYEFLAAVTEKEAASYSETTLEQMVFDITEIVKGNDIPSFFQQAQVLTRS